MRNRCKLHLWCCPLPATAWYIISSV